MRIRFMRTKLPGRNMPVNELSVNDPNGKVNDFSYALKECICR